MTHEILLWSVFNIAVIFLLALDLYFFNRQPRSINIKEALLWCLFWISLALLFNLGIFITRGPHDGLNFLAGYLVEESLSIDNLFVFLVIFNYFKVPTQFTHRVLFFGILGAIIFRTIFIVSGIVLISYFHWLLYLLGAFLIFTGFKLAFGKDKEVDPDSNPIIRIFRAFMPVTSDYDDGKFFIKEMLN